MVDTNARAQQLSHRAVYGNEQQFAVFRPRAACAPTVTPPCSENSATYPAPCAKEVEAAHERAEKCMIVGESRDLICGAFRRGRRLRACLCRAYSFFAVIFSLCCLSRPFVRPFARPQVLKRHEAHQTDMNDPRFAPAPRHSPKTLAVVSTLADYFERHASAIFSDFSSAADIFIA